MIETQRKSFSVLDAYTRRNTGTQLIIGTLIKFSKDTHVLTT